MGEEDKWIKLENLIRRVIREELSTAYPQVKKNDFRPVPPSLCAYCGLPSIGAVNGYRHCREHTDRALYGEKPPKFMPGVLAKPVSGS